MKRRVLVVALALVPAAQADASEVARGAGISPIGLAGPRLVWADDSGGHERLVAARGGRRSVVRELKPAGPQEARAFVTDIAGSASVLAYERTNLVDDYDAPGSDWREVVALRGGRARVILRCRRFDEGPPELGIRVSGRRVAFSPGPCGGHRRVLVDELGHGRRPRRTAYAVRGWLEDFHLAGRYLALRPDLGPTRVVDLETGRTVTVYRPGREGVDASTLLSDGTLVVIYGDRRLRFIGRGARRARLVGPRFTGRQPYAAGRLVAGDRFIRDDSSMPPQQIVTIDRRGRQTALAGWRSKYEDDAIADADAHCVVWTRSAPETVVFARRLPGTRGSPACPG